MAQRVAIIGGGVTGALSAVRLAERGFDVVLLEKAAIGNGSSSRSMAGIRAQFGVAETVLGMLYSQWYYAHFHDLLATPLESRQPVFSQNGYLFLYDDGAALAWERAQAAAAMQQRIGVQVDLLAPTEITRRWPHLDTTRLIGATWSAADGFLYPAVIYGEAIRRAQELGARVQQHTEVLGARHHGGRVLALETSRGRVATDWVVNCTNAWAPRVSARIGGMPLPIAPTKRFLYQLDPGPAWPVDILRQLPMTIYGMGRTLGAHTRPDGRHLLVAGMSHTPPEPAFDDDDQDRIPAEFDHRHGVDNFGFQLLAEVARIAPSLVEDGGLSATSSGYYGMTPDGVPLIGFDHGLSNLVHAAGFSGHGLMHAPVSALLVEALITGAGADDRAPLPPPFDGQSLALGVFDPGRRFSAPSSKALLL